MNAMILASLAIPALVTTVACDCHHGDFHQHLHTMIDQKLGLSPEQKQAAHKVLEAHHPALKADLDAVIQTRADVLEALVDPQSTEIQIRGLEAKGSAACLTMELEVNQAMKEIAPILTPEQHLKARQLVVEARAHLDTFKAGLLK